MRAGTAASAAFKGERSLGEAIDGCGVELIGAGAAHGGDKGVGDRGHNEDLLFADAEQVVVEGRALDDAARSAIEIGGFIHDDRRIAGTACDDALARLCGSLRNRSAARDAEQSDFGMIEDLLGGLDGGFD